MRNLGYINTTIAVLSCLAVISACNKEPQPRAAGGAIDFSGTAGGSERSGSKAYYAGDRYTEGDKTREHIYWSVGDVVRIYCEQASHPNYADETVRHAADYKVAGVLSDKSKANIKLDEEKNINGLHWGTGEHTFYGVYPSPAALGICKSIPGKAVTGTLPQSQNTLSGALTGTSGNYTLAPDLRWQLMVAGPESYEESDSPTVFLKFTPLTTAIQFTLLNENDNSIIIKELGLLSKGKQISGDFSISDVGTPITDGFPAVIGSTLTDENRTVKLELAYPVTLAKDETLTFTFFLAPVSDANDLYLQLTLSDDTALKLRLGRAAADDFLTFPRCKKSFVKVGYTPSGNLIVLSTEIADWKSEGEDVDVEDGSVLTYGDPNVNPWDDEDKGNITYSD